MPKLPSILCVLLLTANISHTRAAENAKDTETSSHSSFILVATPSLNDRYFYHTVLVVTAHGESGYIGLILNHPESATIDKVFPGLKSSERNFLFNGGPNYPDHIFYIVRGAGKIKGSAPFTDNSALAFNTSALQDMLTGKRRQSGLRIMHGMVSWLPGQLENEIRRGIWRVNSFDESLLFDREPSTLWQQLQGIEL